MKDLVCLLDGADEHTDASGAAAMDKTALGEFDTEISHKGRGGQSRDNLLSGGEKQKLVLASILLFLDEASSAPDAQAVQAFHKATKDYSQKTIMIAVMHDVSSIQSESGADCFYSVPTIDDGMAKKSPVAT